MQAFLSCSKNSHEERRLLGGRWEAAFLLMFISVLFSIIVECVVEFFVTTAPTIGFKPLTAGMSGLLLVQRQSLKGKTKLITTVNLRKCKR